MHWYALLIPIIISIIGWAAFKKKIVFWELFVPTGISLVAIIISFYTQKSTSLHDQEYNGYLITEARYYEAWSTWVTKTCSYTTTHSCGKNCTYTTTHYYDCSYCDDHSPQWTMVDSGGNEINISQEKYLALKAKWKADPQFVELNRDIDTHGSCGVDGDMYSIKWDRHILSSETTTYVKDFTNILKCNHSAFNYPVVSPEEAKKAGLYDYPDFGEYNFQNSVLGLDSLNFKHKPNFKAKLNYLNGKLGYKYKVRMYTLIFKNKDVNSAFLQEAYWDGGNQNEIVVCIGTDGLGNIKWVKPFSWCDNKRITVDIRDDLSSLERIDADAFYHSYQDNIKDFWHYKSFEDFNYLSFEPTKGQLIFIYVLTLIVSLGSFIWTIKNDIDEDDNHLY